MTHQNQNPDIREEIDKSREVFKSTLEELGFAGYLPSQMTNSDYWLCTTTAMRRYAQEKDALLLEKEKEIANLVEKIGTSAIHVFQEMEITEKLSGELQSKEERIKELSEFSKSCAELLSRIKCEFEIDTPISLSINRQLTQYNNLTTALSDYIKEEGE